MMHNQPLQVQIALLQKIVLQNELIQNILKLAPSLEMPNWYLGAGCIAQTVWNFFSGFDLNQHIKDFDLVYFDSSNLSYEAENGYIQKANDLFPGIPVEIRNQARVHLWYEKHFGYQIRPHVSVEDAINRWPTTATCVGVKSVNGELLVYAPYGLNDLASMIVRPNKVQITKEIYEQKVTRWKKIWQNLTIVPWD